jgi:hypothetical protein
VLSRSGDVRVHGAPEANQHDRLRACWMAAARVRAYDYFIRVRPDLLVIGTLAAVHTLPSCCVFAKYRAVVGIAHTSSMRQSHQCDCHQPKHATRSARKTPRRCFVVGDQLLVVPAALALITFASRAQLSATRAAVQRAPSASKGHDRLLPYDTCLGRHSKLVEEHLLDRHLKSNNVSMRPLAVESLLDKQAATAYPWYGGGSRACVLEVELHAGSQDSREYARQSAASLPCNTDVWI